MGKTKNKLNSGSQNRKIKENKLLKLVANDKNQKKLCFGSSVLASPAVPSVSNAFSNTVQCSSNSKNVDHDEFLNHENQMEVKKIINETSVSNVEPNTLFHAIQCSIEEINEDSERVIEVGKERDEELKKCLEPLQPVSLFPSLSMPKTLTNTNIIFDINSESLCVDIEIEHENIKADFETHFDAFVFVPPNKNDSIVAKLTFLKHHPIQPIVSNNSKVKFDPRNIYFRKMTNGDIVERRWISYCAFTNKIYCSTCMAFSVDLSNAFVNGVVVNIKNIYLKVQKHENSAIHKTACESYLRACTNKNIDVILENFHNKEVEKNHMVLDRIISIVIVLAKQNLAFRGHRHESISDLDDKTKFNHGNFLAIVQLVAKYDPILKYHIENMIKKRQKKSKSRGRGSLVSFMSKSTVNKIIQIIGQEIQHSISKEIKSTGQFSLEVDSTQDISVTDQLSICVRYVYQGYVKERLLTMVSIISSTGKDQYEVVKNVLKRLDIDVKNLISQSYDGAANMSGEYNGLQKYFKNDAPDSIFTHCHAHVLNLVIGDVTKCNIASQNLFGLLQKTAVFFSESHKRANIWKDNLFENQIGHDKMRKLQKLSNTRWNSKDKALKTIFHSWSEDSSKCDRYICLLNSLHILGYDEKFIKDTKMASEARVLLEKWTSFDIIMISFIYQQIFFFTTPVSKYLQTEGIDYLVAWNKIVILTTNIMKITETFEQIKKRAVTFMDTVETKIDHLENIFIQNTFPARRIKKTKMQSGELGNDSATDFSPEKKFKIEVFQRISDVVSMSMRERFIKNKQLFNAMAYLDPKRFNDINNKILDFSDKYIYIIIVILS